MDGSWLAIIFSTALTAAGLAQPQAGSRLKQQRPVPTLDLRQLMKPKPPQECEIWALNNDLVDGFFIERMLSTVFGISRQQARQIGLRAHTHGSAKVVTLSCPDAEAKLAQADAMARQEHPNAIGILEMVKKG